MYGEKPWVAKDNRNKAKGLPPASGPGAICGAKTHGQNANHEFCHKPAGFGTDHPGYGRCSYHAGTSRSHRQAAVLMQVGERMEARYGDEVDIDPHEALLQEVRRTAGNVEWLQRKVRDVEDMDELTQRTKDGVKGSVWVEMYQKERDMLVKVSQTAISAGVMERQVALAENQGRMVALAIERILDDLELSDAQVAAAPQIVHTRLLELEKGSVRDKADPGS